MKHLAVLRGTLNYEFRMQIRRPALWITMSLLAVLFISLYARVSAISSLIVTALHQYPVLTILASWTLNVNRFLPIGIGVLQADRLPRDRRTRVNELLTAQPAPLGLRLLGKYLGSMLATLTPMLLCYLLGVGFIVSQMGNLAAIPLGLETFVVIALPGIMFVSAFSLACPAIMWVPLYQFCFVGYWFWGNLLSGRAGIPTLSETILTPLGGYMARGFYGLENGDFSATPLQGTESMLLLIALALGVLCALWLFLRWQERRA
jgi:ABC-2 type transport system permease protein